MLDTLNAMPWIEAPAKHTQESLADILADSAAQHQHLCPRQVLGARMGLLGAQRLGVEIPSRNKRLLVFVETDGCAADGVSAATGCTVGHRTLRVIDFGKVAATFVDTAAGRAVRIAPSRVARELAARHAPLARSRWHAQLEAYQIIPDGQLFVTQPVELSVSLDQLLSKPGRKAVCGTCGEEIINEREVILGDKVLCRACAGDVYYRAKTNPVSQRISPLRGKDESPGFGVTAPAARR